MVEILSSIYILHYWTFFPNVLRLWLFISIILLARHVHIGLRLASTKTKAKLTASCYIFSLHKLFSLQSSILFTSLTTKSQWIYLSSLKRLSWVGSWDPLCSRSHTLRICYSAPVFLSLYNLRILDNHLDLNLLLAIFVTRVVKGFVTSLSILYFLSFGSCHLKIIFAFNIFI